MIKKSIILSLLTASIFSGAVNAGYEVDRQVYIKKSSTSSTNIMRGSLQDAHDSSDNTQYIYCGTKKRPVNSFVEGYCYARDTNGQYAYLTTSDPDTVKTIQSINASSHVQVHWSRTDPTITYISVINGSLYLN